MHILKRIFVYLREFKLYLAFAFLIMLLSIFLAMAIPYLTKVLIDDVIIDSNYSILKYVLAIIIITSLIRGIFRFCYAYLFEKVSQYAVFNIRHDLYQHLQRLSFSFYDKSQTGELMSRMTSDLEGIRGFIALGFPLLFEQFFMFIVTLIILLSINIRLTLISLLVIPFIGVIAIRFDKNIRNAFKDIREQMAVLNTTLQENIAGVRVVKAFARESYETGKFCKENHGNMMKNIKAGELWSRFFPLVEFLSGLCIVLLLWYGGYLVIKDIVTIGVLVAFSNYLWNIIWPIRIVGWLVNMMEQAISGGIRIFNLLDTSTEIKNKPGALKPDKVKGYIHFNNVCFKYEDKFILEDINITAHPGKVTAIMGATGSGKSSIINLISRFYDCTSGEITVDNQDIKDYHIKKLRSSIGIIMQETFLFSDTIRENIAYGKRNATLEQVMEASKAAQAHEFIMNLPYGYDTYVGERGMGLSGGQKQRIAIARALLVKPSILILDDATSSVDMETEHSIQNALRGIIQNRTVFIITHRISSVKDADEIIYIEKGKVVERGTHESLLNISGRYYDIYIEQFKDYEDIVV